MGDRQIGFVTVGRSDRGHLSPLLALFPDAHLYGWWSGAVSTREDVAYNFGLAVGNFSHQFTMRRPDLLVIFGDRWEQLAAATAGMILNLPLVHLHAGEETEAVIDDTCRAAISAMCQIHIAAARAYGARLRLAGYRRVYELGSPGIARLPVARENTPGARVIAVAFHPETRNVDDVQRQAHELRMALYEMGEPVIFTAPGMDAGRQAILDELADLYPPQMLSDDEWLTLLAGADVLVGNSSCGIIEAPSIPLASVNIGDRQKGRLQASSVIQVAHDRHAIRAGIARALTPEWRMKHLTGENPYGDRHAAARIAELLTTCAL